MHPTLMMDLARELGAERLRAADRARIERASRAAQASRAARRASRLSRLSRMMRMMRGASARASDPIDRMTAAALEVPAR
jgi:hypothetical protein